MAVIPPSTANGPLEPLAVSALELGRMLGLSVRTIRTMNSAGKLPRPVKLNGHAVRWVLDGPQDIRAWLAAGAPNRSEFEAKVNAELTNKKQ